MSIPVTVFATTSNPELDEKVESAIDVIASQMRKGRRCGCGYSGGKDSSITLSLMTQAAERVMREGINPGPLYLVTADTEIENPEIHYYLDSQLDAFRLWGEQHSVEVIIIQTTPNLLASWVIKTLSGHQRPTYPHSRNRQCAIDMKKGPVEAAIRKLTRQFKQNGQSEPVQLLGTRLDESARRKIAMEKAGQNYTSPIRNKLGILEMSPIATFTTDEVYEYLALAGINKQYPSFQDNFEETLRIYRDAAGECMVVADAANMGTKAGCSARFGCAFCVAVGTDKSMVNMVSQDKYAYMAGLLKVRDYVANIAWDLDSFRWIHRDVDPLTQHVLVWPNGFSAKTTDLLARCLLTLDKREQDRADQLAMDLAEGKVPDTAWNRRMAQPQFCILPPEKIVALDFVWALDHMHRPHHAIKLWHDVYMNGIETEVPVIAPVPKPEAMPEKRYLFVGDYDRTGWEGLRDLIGENFSPSCFGQHRTRRIMEDGQAIRVQAADYNLESSFTVYDTAADALFFEFKTLVRHHDETDYSNAQAVWYWLRLGVVALPKGMESMYDLMLKRGAFWQKHGLAGEVAHPDLMTRTISEAEHTALLKQALARHGHYDTIPTRAERITLTREARMTAAKDFTDETLFASLEKLYRREIALASMLTENRMKGILNPFFDGVELSEAQKEVRINLRFIRDARQDAVGQQIANEARLRAHEAAYTLIQQADPSKTALLAPGFGAYLAIYDRSQQLAELEQMFMPAAQHDLFDALVA
jgi:DNA sulfur modification protein DndC